MNESLESKEMPPVEPQDAVNDWTVLLNALLRLNALLQFQARDPAQLPVSVRKEGDNLIITNNAPVELSYPTLQKIHQTLCGMMSSSSPLTSHLRSYRNPKAAASEATHDLSDFLLNKNEIKVNALDLIAYFRRNLPEIVEVFSEPDLNKTVPGFIFPFNPIMTINEGKLPKAKAPVNVELLVNRSGLTERNIEDTTKQVSKLINKTSVLFEEFNIEDGDFLTASTFDSKMNPPFYFQNPSSLNSPLNDGTVYKKNIALFTKSIVANNTGTSLYGAIKQALENIIDNVETHNQLICVVINGKDNSTTEEDKTKLASLIDEYRQDLASKPNWLKILLLDQSPPEDHEENKKLAILLGAEYCNKGIKENFTVGIRTIEAAMLSGLIVRTLKKLANQQKKELLGLPFTAAGIPPGIKNISRLPVGDFFRAKNGGAAAESLDNQLPTATAAAASEPLALAPVEQSPHSAAALVEEEPADDVQSPPVEDLFAEAPPAAESPAAESNEPAPTPLFSRNPSQLDLPRVLASFFNNKSGGAFSRTIPAPIRTFRK
jgi:hypothetical protein